jgi:hypothetical protein
LVGHVELHDHAGARARGRSVVGGLCGGYGEES